MSALGDRLRRLAGRDRPSFGDVDAPAERGLRNGLVLAAAAADEAEHVALADSAEGRGQHAALALRWAAERLGSLDQVDVGGGDSGADVLRRWAERADSR